MGRGWAQPLQYLQYLPRQTLGNIRSLPRCVLHFSPRFPVPRPPFPVPRAYRASQANTQEVVANEVNKRMGRAVDELRDKYDAGGRGYDAASDAQVRCGVVGSTIALMGGSGITPLPPPMRAMIPGMCFQSLRGVPGRGRGSSLVDYLSF